MLNLRENGTMAIPGEQVESLVMEVPTLAADEFGERAREVFESRPDIEGIVVLEYGNPVGLIMRGLFFQKMSAQYGYSLYMKRPVSILMDREFLSADAGDSLSKVGLEATARGQEKLYDYIVVFKEHAYLGVISIRLFFEELSRRNEAQVQVLREQQKRLLLAHEEELQLRKGLEHQSAAIRNLLDHAEQGFLWFGRDLRVQSEVSDKCRVLFGRNVSGADFLGLVAEYFPEDRGQVFAPALESYFRNNDPVTDAVYLMLLPSDCVLGGCSLQLRYRRIESSGEKAVMVVISDVTERAALERAMEADRNKLRLLIKSFGAQGQIRRMLEEFRELFSSGYRGFFSVGVLTPENLDELFRAVHTYKGDFAQYGFISASDRIHLLEDRLSGLLSSEASAESVEAIFKTVAPEDILAEDLQVIAEFLGKDYFEKSEMTAVPRDRLSALKERLESGELDSREAADLIGGLMRMPVKDYLEQYRDYVEYLSAKVGKPMPVFLVEGEDVAVDEEQFEGVFRSLVHIFRNAMDHGIESDEERVQAGKTPEGLIQCRVSGGEDGCFSILISDDGRGIPVEKLGERVLERGLLTPEQLSGMGKEDLCDLVFADHISTKEGVSSLSGRGVGMSAVRSACRSLGGEIHVESQAGRGSAFLLELPQRQP